MSLRGFSLPAGLKNGLICFLYIRPTPAHFNGGFHYNLGMNEPRPSYPRILPVGDAALTVEFGDQIRPDLNNKVYALERAINLSTLPGIVEMVPSYRSLLIAFDPLSSDLPAMKERIAALLPLLNEGEEVPSREVEIPVRYGGANGPDLAFVAEYNQLTPQEVIQLHTSRTYPIYMMGFTPGFPYLGGMDLRIAAPRLETPRTLVPAGSVGIAGEQTGIYSINSPGGWRIIGRTDMKLFNPTSETPFLLAPGDRIRFVAVGEGMLP